VNKNKALYISDLDGTLLDGSAELSEYTTNALNAMIANGLHFSIATARTFATSGQILADLKLSIPIVLMNGVLIYDIKRQRYIKANKLPAETVEAIIAVLRSLNAAGLMYELRDSEMMTYYESLEQKPIRDFVEERMTRYNKTFRQTAFSDVSPEHIIYFTLLDTYDKIKPIHDTLAAQLGLNLTMYKDIYSPDLWYLEMFSDEASKKNGVDYLRQTCGYERIICFGDNLNDLPMFAACDIRVAVENAKPEVKAIADHICDTNNNDGVAKWLEEYTQPPTSEGITPSVGCSNTIVRRMSNG